MIDKVSRTITGRIKLARAAIEIARVKGRPLRINDTRFSRDRWKDSIANPTDFYFDCVQFFHSGFENLLRDHRFFFATNGRGFGEDAFHVLWWMLLQELRPKTFLEIGVYRGQVLSLVSLLQGILQINGTVTGISRRDLALFTKRSTPPISGGGLSFGCHCDCTKKVGI